MHVENTVLLIFKYVFVPTFQESFVNISAKEPIIYSGIFRVAILKELIKVLNFAKINFIVY